MKVKYARWHNNYDFVLGEIYYAMRYSKDWLLIKGQLYRSECFDEIRDTEPVRYPFSTYGSVLGVVVSENGEFRFSQDTAKQACEKVSNKLSASCIITDRDSGEED